MARIIKCHRTKTERDLHKSAVELSNMTDMKFYRYIEAICHKASQEAVADFLSEIDKVEGIGGVTIAKIKKFAVARGYVKGDIYDK